MHTTLSPALFHPSTPNNASSSKGNIYWLPEWSNRSFTLIQTAPIQPFLAGSGRDSQLKEFIWPSRDFFKSHTYLLIFWNCSLDSRISTEARCLCAVSGSKRDVFEEVWQWPWLCKLSAVALCFKGGNGALQLLPTFSPWCDKRPLVEFLPLPVNNTLRNKLLRASVCTCLSPLSHSFTLTSLYLSGFFWENWGKGERNNSYFTSLHYGRGLRTKI